MATCVDLADVVDYEGLYFVTKNGEIYRKTATKIKPVKAWLNRLGYPCVTLSKENNTTNKTVHQLVAAAYIPNFTYGNVINHKDGNKENNNIDNLEMCSYVHNNTHAHATGLMPKPGKSKYHNVSTRIDKRNRHPKIEYLAAVKINGKRHYIGLFTVEEEAAKAVDAFLDSIGDTVRRRNFP